MGTPGMRFSLPSRDLIADSMETVMGAMSYDAMVTVVGCDKNMPGALMAMLRLNRPSVLLYGGTIAAGCLNDQKLDVVSAFEAWGQKVAGSIDEKEFKAVVKMLVPELAHVVECIRLTRWHPRLKRWECLYPTARPIQQWEGERNRCSRSRKSLRFLLQNDIKPRDIVTKKSLENALR